MSTPTADYGNLTDRFAVQHASGTTAQHAAFAGLNAELTVDTTKKTLVVHDGIREGGFPLAHEITIDPKSYGAKGNRDDDDTLALQAAINAAYDAGGGTVSLVGKFKIMSKLVLKPNVNLRGQNSARLSAHAQPNTIPPSEIYNAGTGVALEVKDSGGYRNKISDLTISGNGSSSHGIDAASVYDVQVDNCMIYGHGGNGINVNACASWKLTNNFIYDCNYGLKTDADTNGWLIAGNHIQKCRSYGAWIDSAWGCQISGNTIEGNVDRELYLRGPGGVTVSGNYFEGGTPAAQTKIYIDSGIRAVTITGNFFNTPAADGIGVFLGDGSYEITSLVISNNWFRYLKWAVYVASTVNLSNAFFGPNYFGGTVPETADSTITPNRYFFAAGEKANVHVFDDQAPKWIPINYVKVGATCTNDSGKLYTCATAGTTASSGGPTGTGSGITDGTAVWNYTEARTYGETFYGNKTLEGVERSRSYISVSLPSWCDYVYTRRTACTLANNGNDSIGGGKCGFGRFVTNGGDRAFFFMHEGGTVELFNASAGVSNTLDNAGTWNLYLDGNGKLHVQNKTGATSFYVLVIESGFHQ